MLIIYLLFGVGAVAGNIGGVNAPPGHHSDVQRRADVGH